MAEENKLKIIYCNEETEIDFRGGCFFTQQGYCGHPSMAQNRLECRYGLTEINVPKKCPLRQGPTRIELIILEANL